MFANFCQIENSIAKSLKPHYKHKVTITVFTFRVSPSLFCLFFVLSCALNTVGNGGGDGGTVGAVGDVGENISGANDDEFNLAL